jgi:murein DD-endopeptidase MepM/ murein hydrolase activator NlpD
LSLSIVRRLPCALVLLALATPASAAAHSASAGTGGASVPVDPKVANVICEDSSAWECSRGARLTLEGEALDGVAQVRFVGGRGSRDDRTVRPRRVEAHRLEVQVPRSARSGPIAVTGADGARAKTSRSLRVRAAVRRATVPALVRPTGAGGGVFPIPAEHTYGTGVNRFGGGRGHQGQDVFADCGTPLVALYDATVQHVASHSRAGNYVVLQAADGQSYAYMHMQAAAQVRKGDAVRAGQQVGRVGDTGRATGCHLHFEQWTAPGWYEGGAAIDPLALLQSLDG